MTDSRYVLITAARNEEAVIRYTLESMLSQILPPTEWVIVSDGSTDRTDELVKEAMLQKPWIKLIQLAPRSKPCLAARINAISHGMSHVTQTDYSFVGILDADLRFRPDYFHSVIEEFQKNPRLGIAGGMAVDVDESTMVGDDNPPLPRNQLNIPGAVQLFRRECYAAIGGYRAIPEGGSDTIACAHARMLGYETKLLTHLVVDHLKPRNIWAGGPLRRKWQMGARDYALGYHPLFELVKCLSRVVEPPLLVGSLAWWLGYVARSFVGANRMLPSELVAHIRKEQLRRIV